MKGFMKRFVLLFTAMVIILIACKNKKKVSLNEESDEVTTSDFVESFPDLTLPFQLYDTSLVKKPADSLMVATKLFTQFFPDSIFRKDFGKSMPVLYAIGKTAEKNKETYLFVRAAQGSKRTCVLICLDKDNNFLKAMTLV